MLSTAIEMLFILFSSYHLSSNNHDRMLLTLVLFKTSDPILKGADTLKEASIHTSSALYYPLHDLYIYYWRKHMMHIRIELIGEVLDTCTDLLESKMERSDHHQLTISAEYSRLRQLSNKYLLEYKAAEHDDISSEGKMNDALNKFKEINTHIINLHLSQHKDETFRVFNTNDLTPMIMTPDSLEKLCQDELLLIVIKMNNLSDEQGQSTMSRHRSNLIDNNYAKHLIEGREIEFSNFQSQRLVISPEAQYISESDYLLWHSRYINQRSDRLHARRHNSDSSSLCNEADLTVTENLTAARGYLHDTEKHIDRRPAYTN